MMSTGPWQNPPAKATCPHCGRQTTAYHLQFHMDRCPFNPDIYEATRAALDDGTGKIKRYQDYQRESNGGKASANVPAVSILMSTFQQWSAVAEAFNLRFEPFRANSGRIAPIDQKANEIGAELDRMHADDEEVKERTLREFDGLRVCRVIETPTEIRYLLR